MIKIENYEVLGWEHAIRGMRNPLNSWDKSDSEWSYCGGTEAEGYVEAVQMGCEDEGYAYDIGPNDKDLMMRLRNAGTDHRKFMRMLVVYVDITAPLYWWKECDTYKVGTVANSCSTMHKIASKEFTLEDFSTEHLIIESEREGFLNWGDVIPMEALHIIIRALNESRIKYLQTNDKRYWWQMIQLLPSSYNQKRTVMLNYEVLANIYKSRKNHKLDEWHQFCDWIMSLPFSELITGAMPEIDKWLLKPETAKEDWPATPEEIKKSFDEFSEAVDKIQNMVVNDGVD